MSQVGRLEPFVRNAADSRSGWKPVLRRYRCHARRAKSGRSVPSGNALPRQHPAQPVSAGSRDELPRRGHGRRNRTPLPPLELVAPSLINSTPAASRAAITLVRLSITPRTVPLLASMRWIVGSDTPDATARAFWSMPASTRAAFICAAVSNVLLQHAVTNFLRTHSLTTQTSYLISTSCFQHQNCHLEPVRPYVDITLLKACPAVATLRPESCTDGEDSPGRRDRPKADRQSHRILPGGPGTNHRISRRRRRR